MRAPDSAVPDTEPAISAPPVSGAPQPDAPEPEALLPDAPEPEALLPDAPELAALEAADASSQTANPVLLVHGLRTSATMWRAQLAELRAAGITAEAMDLPGHGTRLGERFTMDAARRSIGDGVEALAAASGRRPYLVGFSLGGYLSIDWVGRNPGAVCGLLAASCGTVPGRLVLDGWRVLARGIHRFPDRGLALNNLAVRTVVPQPGADDVIAGGVALEVMEDVLVGLRHLDPIGSLRAIDEPVLFVNGRLDHIRWHAARFLAAATDARLITIAGATHMVSVARPREFTDALLDGYADATGRAAIAG